jgi:CrcB protein
VRYLVSSHFNRFFSQIPLGTLIANTISCLIAGFVSYLVIYYSPIKNIDEKIKLLFITGFCGGFSTFSSFALENINFIKTQQISNFLLYTLMSLLTCHVAIIVGLIIANQVVAKLE